MCSSGLRYCQFLVKVFSSSSSSGTRRGDQTDDHTGNDARKPDVTPQVSGLFVFAVFFFLFFFVDLSLHTSWARERVPK